MLSLVPEKEDLYPQNKSTKKSTYNTIVKHTICKKKEIKAKKKRLEQLKEGRNRNGCSRLNQCFSLSRDV